MAEGLLKLVPFIKLINQMTKHEELPVPSFSTLEPVYGDGSQLEEAQLRFDKLKSKFIEVFGHQPDTYARSPGLLFISHIFFFMANSHMTNNPLYEHLMMQGA